MLNILCAKHLGSCTSAAGTDPWAYVLVGESVIDQSALSKKQLDL